MVGAAVLEAILGELAAAAMLRIADEFTRQTSNKKARRRRVEAAAILSRIDYSASPLALSVLLPKGVTSADIESMLRSPEVSAMVYEVTCLQLTNALAPAFDSLLGRWRRFTLGRIPALGLDAADGLFDFIRSQQAIALEVLAQHHAAEFEILRAESFGLRATHAVEAIERMLRTRTPDVDLGALDVFCAQYRAQVKAAEGHIEPPDFEHRQKVPIDELYVTPTIYDVQSGLRESHHAPVEDLLGCIDRTVLLGDPGHGKSTASQVLLYRAALSKDQPVPFLVTLREYAAPSAREELSVVEYIEAKLKSHYHCGPDIGFVEHLLGTGGAMVIFDGLDELLDTSKRRSVTDAVGHFCIRYPLTRVLVTSRRVGYEQAPMDPRIFRVLQLSEFNEDQVSDYVHKWFSRQDGPSRARGWTSSFLDESSDVSDLRATPLLLALMCIIYRGEKSIPRNRPGVYEKCATMLYEKWDGHRKLNVELQAGHMVDPAMKHLAYWLWTQRTGADGVTESELVSETAAFFLDNLFENAYDAKAAAEEFVEFCSGRAWVFSDVGSTPDGESLYKFTHRTFLEYFSALHLSRITDTPEDLARALLPHVASAEWDVVAQLAVQITDKNSAKGATRIFEAMLNDKRRRTAQKRANILLFLARCLSFVQISPPTLRHLVREIFATTIASRGDQREPRPIGALMIESEDRDIAVIQDELAVCLAESLSSGLTTEASLNAADLLLCNTTPAYHYAAFTAKSKDEKIDRWTAFFENLTETHKTDLIEASQHDANLRALVAGIRLVSMRDATPMTPGDPPSADLNWLFDGYRSRIFGYNYLEPAISYLLRGMDMERVSDKWRARHIAILHELGEIVLDGNLTRIASARDSVRLLRVTFQHRKVRSELAKGEDHRPRSLDVLELLACGFILACALEGSAEVSQGILESDWGGVEPVRGILLARIDPTLPTADPSNAPELDILRRWSRSEVNFTLARPARARGEEAIGLAEQ
ncbi:NACHT domain-containing protein [Kribbella speibonae]|uniref:NACHT domain-containing protein n=2 Tax=Kribbella speibonae TaxID=1572660 RepID=A0ABY1ZW54_9ACTN|nr:NACHT domain-containing protein [Kribbella speibonae]